MTDATLSLAYIAGFVDGEGCISTTSAGTNIIPRVSVSNTDPRIPCALKDGWGGSVAEKRRIKANWKRAYEWTVTASAALAFLREIRPFLVIKAERADVALSMLALRGRSGVSPSPELLAARVAAADVLHALNRKGVAA